MKATECGQISVKSCDTSQASDFIAKLKEDADKLFGLKMSNADVPIANKILDIRVQPGGSSHIGLQEVRAHAEDLGLAWKSGFRSFHRIYHE